MRRAKTFEERKCPFCGEHVSYWPNCSPNTCEDYYDVAYSKTKRNTLIFFHKSCYMKNTIGAKVNG